MLIAAYVPKTPQWASVNQGVSCPFCGTLDPENRRVLFATLMPSDEIEESYPPQFSHTNGAPAILARLALGALFIKQRLGLSYEETVD